jgi:hypothetical protein
MGDAVRLNYYKSALYSTAAIAMIELIANLYLVSYSVERVPYTRALMAFLILFGLWVQSNNTRILGAIWFLIMVGSVIWPLFTLDKVNLNFVAILFLVSSALGLFVSYTLLLSKQFKTEFFHELEKRPKYKKTLRIIVVVGIVLAGLIATMNDIIHLANN